MSTRRMQGGSPRRGRGFSLVELMVALAAGVIVALGVIGISHEATNTLHEEVRVAGAENGLRVAVELLRADLQRASYMSTANIMGDPMIARRAGSIDNLSNQLGGGAAAAPGLRNLAGIHLYSGGALSTPVPPTTYQVASPVTAVAISPDAIDIGGNMSSADEYPAFACGGPAPQPTPPSPNPCNGPVMCLEMNTPAMWRIRNQPTPATATNATALAAIQAAFQPGSPNSTTQYMARITDASGHYQYVLTCAGSAKVVTGSVATGFQVNIDPNSAVLAPSDTGGQGGVAGISAGLVVISPVEVVHWDLMCSPTNPACPGTTQIPAAFQFGATAGAVLDPNEFFLTRGYVDAVTGLLDPFSLEVVAEYAVDLKFGFTVDTSNAAITSPPGAYTGVYPLQAYAVDDSVHNSGWATGVFGATTPPNQAWVPANGVATQAIPEPQRIRSVRARIGIRSQFADRNITITPPTVDGAYLYRYQLLPATSTAALKYARVRESVTEVTLANQARFFW